MFAEIFSFEFRYHVRGPVFWLGLVLFFIMAFFAVSSDQVTVGGSIGQVNRNAPFVIMQLLVVMSIVGIWVNTAFVASSLHRDRELRTQELFFSTRMSKRDYLLGRFAGALTVALTIFVGICLAILVGSWMPWLDSERVGPFQLMPYVFSFLILVLPNVLSTGSIFFAVAVTTRSMIWTYVSVVGFFVGYLISQAMLGDVDNERIGALLDPFGFAAFTLATKYWTVADKNTALIPLGRDLLLNRAIWLGVAALFVAYAYWSFKFGTDVGRSRKGKQSKSVDAEPEALSSHAHVWHRRRPSPFTIGLGLRQLWQQTRIETRGVVLSAPFLVICAFGMFNIVGTASSIGQWFGTPLWPVSHLLLQVIAGSFAFLIFIILGFYAGELVFRERGLNVAGVYDALPAPNWVFWGAKLVALVAGIVALMTAATATAIGIQAYNGYFNFELSVYAKGLFLQGGVGFLLIAVMAMFLQVLTNNKYLGFLVMILLFISTNVLAAFDYDHYLYRIASAPLVPYSDMNGFGHFVTPMFWFYLYWSFLSIGLLVAVHLLWVRGVVSGGRERIRIALQRLPGAPQLLLAGSLVAFALTGGFIYYNTNILNAYLPGDVRRDRQADYEKTYKKYAGLAQPRITAVEADVDIFPAKRALAIRGTYTLRNKTDQPIDELHLWLSPEVTSSTLDVPGSTIEMVDGIHGQSIRRLAEPLAPGAEIELRYEIAVDSPGFRTANRNVLLVENGTFFDSSHYFPHIGYQSSNELQDPNERRKRDLEAVIRMPKLEDEAARRDNALSSEADWIHFETVVSTSDDQVAMAPGYLQREWTEDGRRYFHYKMDAPILAYWAYLSARWDVVRDSWNDVPIEVYHHPTHTYNTDRMIDSVKKSLDYFTTNFSPYQHRQVRILEFPRYRSFAQSFPNTIPYSESIGFIARLDDPDEIDFVFYVTAHEIAHQWWAHQVIGGNVQGSTLLAETLSQYSALMVMEKEYGPDHMRRFLKWELDRYLRRRGGELIEELPIMRVENQQYIHYNKGSIVMYALKDAIGEEALNGALARFIERTAFQEPPYTTTTELLAELRRVTPDDRQYMIEDLFETITLYDNRVETATVTQNDDRWTVTLALTSRKLRADGLGAETEVPIDDWIDVAVFGERVDGGPPEGKLLALKKIRIDSDTTEVKLEVAERPAKAGVDPFHKLVDRNPDDNLTRTTGG